MAEITREQAAALADAICSTAFLNVTLRDFFAAFALAGLVAQTDRTMPTKVFAEEAYKCADAMLAQRQKQEN